MWCDSRCLHSQFCVPKYSIVSDKIVKLNYFDLLSLFSLHDSFEERPESCSIWLAICFKNFNLDLEILTGVQSLMPLNTKSYPFISFCVNGMQLNLSSCWLAVRIPMWPPLLWLYVNFNVAFCLLLFYKKWKKTFYPQDADSEVESTRTFQ